MLPDTSKETKKILRSSKLQLWGAVALAGLFLLITQNVTSLMLTPIYVLSLYAALRYTASGFMSVKQRSYYRKSAYFGLIAVVSVSILIAMFNPVSQYKEDRKVNSYINSPYEYQSDTGTRSSVRSKGTF